jgi:hypothetical protein
MKRQSFKQAVLFHKNGYKRYNPLMNETQRHTPDANRLSVLAAAVLLTYALPRLLEIQSPILNWNLLGLAISIPLSLGLMTIFLAAVLTAAGTDWLLRSHPNFESEISLQHWLLPALTSFALGTLLFNLAATPAWWGSFLIGGVLLLMVLVAEYIVLDSSDTRYTFASAGLIAVSFSLFLVLSAALSYAGARLILVLFVLFPATGLVSLRAIHLRVGRWEWQWAAGIALACAQIAAALHYWPLSPVQHGLATLAPLYILTGLAINLGDGMPLRRALLEAGIYLALFCLAVLFVG